MCKGKEIILKVVGKYELNLKIPINVIESSQKAKFDKKSQKLRISFKPEINKKMDDKKKINTEPDNINTNEDLQTQKNISDNNFNEKVKKESCNDFQNNNVIIQELKDKKQNNIESEDNNICDNIHNNNSSNKKEVLNIFSVSTIENETWILFFILIHSLNKYKLFHTKCIQ